MGLDFAKERGILPASNNDDSLRTSRTDRVIAGTMIWGRFSLPNLNFSMTILGTSKQIVLDFFGQTDVGRVRSENEDSYSKFPSHTQILEDEIKGHLFIIADGMGGFSMGKQASRLAVQSIGTIFYADPGQRIPRSLKDGFDVANKHIYEQWIADGGIQKMGTTCTALVISLTGVYIAHVGDSRVYVINRRNIRQLTQDHTHVAELHRHGLLTKEETKNNPQRSMLNRALGVEESVEVDIFDEIPLRVGDIFVMCTDGLGSVSDKELKAIALENSPQQACETLIHLAKQRDGTDNITVLVIRVRRSRIRQHA